MNKRMPVIFSGHGSPMIAIENNELTQKMNEIGEYVIDNYEKPKAILAISAHWYCDGTFIQSSKFPKQIYDMYGFPEELYDIKYPVSGNRELTDEILDLIDEIEINDEWGIDHGTWSVLVHMFPDADIPVVQLSVNRNLTPQKSYELGKQLSSLRDKGYLIFASGNIVHNLMMVEWDNLNGSDKCIKFNEYVIDKILKNDLKEVINYRNIDNWDYAVPTPDHYLPLLYALGASGDDNPVIFNNSCNLGSIAMTGFLFE